MTSHPIELIEAYRQARRLGRRYVADMRNRGESGFLPLLEEGLRELLPEIGLGLVEVPLHKIRGTYSVGRQSALAGNFMPLLAEDSEFSRKWRNVLAAHSEEGLRDPIQVYEFLGWYYVREGNKRVSVLTYQGAYSYPAQVTRLLPPMDAPDEAVRVFYELIGEDKRRAIGHMWFSRHGTFTKLMQLARAKHPENAEDTVRESFRRFRPVYRACGGAELPLTTGDAFAEYVQIYGFPLDTPEKELVLNIRNCAPLYKTEGAVPVLSDPDDMETRARMLLRPKSNRLTVAFVYAGRPPAYGPAAHDAGRLRLEREYPQVTFCRYCAEPDASNSYQTLSLAASEAKPDLLFATDRRMEPAALRVSLERHETLVLQCAAGAGRRALSTYYGNTADAAFLCGVAAGALTQSGSVGFIPPGTTRSGSLPQDLQAFAQGVCMVRPWARVWRMPMPIAGLEGRFEACAALAQAGCDVAWLPILPNTPLEYKHFPGVYAFLCRLGADGRPCRRVAAAAWHWDAFYASLLQKITQDGQLSGPFPLHFRMGMSAGVVDAHLIYPAETARLPKLFAHFRHLIRRGEVDTLDEEMVVEVEEGI